MIARFFFFPFSTRLWKEFPCRCTPFCVRPILWITWNENYAISLPFCYCQMRTQVGAKYENKTHANDTHFCQLFLRSFFFPSFWQDRFYPAKKKSWKNKPKKLTEYQHFSLVSFHFSITLLRLRWTTGHTPRVRLGMCYGSLTAKSDATNGNVSSSSRSFAD